MGATGAPTGARWLGRPTPGDRVTGGRALLVLVCAALVTWAYATGGSPRSWLVVGLALIAWVLDAADGYVARHTDSVTERGARLDAGVDAVLALVMAVAIAPVAPWAVATGLLYPAFLLGRALRPAWRATPPAHRWWQKVAGATFTGTVVIGAAPIWPDLAVQIATAAAVIPVLASFARDIAWLERHAQPVAGPSARR